LQIFCTAVGFDLDNPITAIDLERHVVEEPPGRRKILKVVKRSALRKARSVASFDAQRNSLTTNQHEWTRIMR